MPVYSTDNFYPFYLRFNTVKIDDKERLFQFPHTVNTFTPKEYGFNLGYNYLNLEDKQGTNLDIFNVMSVLPGWSSGNKNFFSNASKVISPVHEAISASVLQMDNFTNDGFGYRDEFFQYIYSPTAKIPKNIKTSDGLYAYVGEERATSIEAFAASDLETEQIYNPIIKATVSGFTVFTQENYLYVRYTEVIDVSSLPIISIYGVDAKGTQITETLTFNSTEITQKTAVKFKVVSSIISNKKTDDFQIRNYFDVSRISYENRTGPKKKVASRYTGEYYTPSISREDNNLYLFSVSNIYKREELNFYLNTDAITDCFVNNLLDVVVRDDDGELFVGKLLLKYNGRQGFNSTCNNNNYIFLEDEHTNPGDDVIVNVNAKLIRDEYETTLVQVQYGDLFFKQDGSADLNPNNWIDLVGVQHQLKLAVERDDLEDMEFVLKVNGVVQRYSCLNYLNTVDLNRTSAGIVDEIFVYNDELIVEKDNKLHKLKTKRRVFTSATTQNGRTLIFPNNLDKIYL